MKKRKQKTAPSGAVSEIGLFSSILFNHGGQSHKDDSQKQNSECKICDVHIFFNINNNYLHNQRLTIKHATAKTDPVANDTTSNLPSITGSTTEATSTIPRSEQMSDNFFNCESDNIGQGKFICFLPSFEGRARRHL